MFILCRGWKLQGKSSVTRLTPTRFEAYGNMYRKSDGRVVGCGNTSAVPYSDELEVQYLDLRRKSEAEDVLFEIQDILSYPWKRDSISCSWDLMDSAVDLLEDIKGHLGTMKGSDK